MDEVLLTTLSETASDLASLRDVDEILTAICRRSRALLGADAAYIALRDEQRGDTYVRATDGVVSEPFRRLRLPVSAGVGGLVAAEGIPVATSDYLEDARFVHTAELDRCVREEGLRAIVGVPLRRGEEVSGVLMGGFRAPRRLEPTEVGWFQALAAHAAIAIHDRRAEAAASLHEELARLLVAGGGPAELLEAIARSTGAELELLDADGARLAGGGAPWRGCEAGEIPVLAGGERLGTLRWSATEPGVGADRVELLERGCTILAGQLL
ncbi:MAG TPA: GAF domain-containing protein, partial [Solirubrobacterales bacterium]|nr:GAF domain-containing protein [Solirubrobacterales bacterium]